MLGFRDLLSKASGLISSSVEQVKAPVNEKDAADAPGRSLVARHENSWGVICTNSSTLAGKVSVDEARVQQIAVRCEAELSAWARMKQELEALTEVGDSVNTLKAEMEQLCNQLQIFDACLDEHTQARQEKEFKRWQMGVERDTAIFAQAKEKELMMLEKSLKADMAKRVRARMQEQAAAAAASASLAKKQDTSSSSKAPGDAQPPQEDVAGGKGPGEKARDTDEKAPRELANDNAAATHEEKGDEVAADQVEGTKASGPEAVCEEAVAANEEEPVKETTEETTEESNTE